MEPIQSKWEKIYHNIQAIEEEISYRVERFFGSDPLSSFSAHNTLLWEANHKLWSFFNSIQFKIHRFIALNASQLLCFDGKVAWTLSGIKCVYDSWSTPIISITWSFNHLWSKWITHSVPWRFCRIYGSKHNWVTHKKGNESEQKIELGHFPVRYNWIVAKLSFTCKCDTCLRYSLSHTDPPPIQYIPLSIFEKLLGEILCHLALE